MGPASVPKVGIGRVPLHFSDTDPPSVRIEAVGDLSPGTWSALAALHARTGIPVTAQEDWLQTWVECFTSYQAVAVLVKDEGGLAAAALLAYRRRSGWTEVRAVGYATSDQVRFPALHPAAAAELATGVAGMLRRLRRPWRLNIEQLPPGDPVTKALISQLPWAQLRPGDPSPTVRFTHDRSLRSYTTRNHHQASRRLANRVRRAELTETVEVLTEPAAIDAVLPDLERICRQRDHQLGRSSAVDDPEAGPFFRAIVRRLAKRRRVVLTTLRLSGQLAAYVLCFVDDSAHRMWNTRFDPAFAEFGPGRLAADAALSTALADETVVEFDWMRGDEPYKYGTATDVVPAVRLVAWSSPWYGWAEAALRLARRCIRRGARHCRQRLIKPLLGAVGRRR